MTITLDAIKAEQTKLARMIADFEAQAHEPIAYLIDETEIDLAPGERYAGLVLDQDGDVSHHLVLLPGESESLTWDRANTWAQEMGGVLPTRQEQALLYANLKAQFKPEWYWSSEVHETNGSYAWFQFFDYGGQFSGRKSYEGRARAVRRVTA